MARPIRESLDYYPFDVDFFSDIKITKLKIKSGYNAILVLIYLYSLIYGDKGYYTTSEDAKLLLMDYFQKDDKEIENIINLFIEMNLIDKKMYEKNKIFTSVGIQKRYLEVAKRRKGRSIKSSYCLVNVTETGVNVTETGVNVTETGVNVTFSTQRKEKERKGKERKERGNNARARETSHSVIPYGKFHNVLLTHEEYQEIHNTYENPRKLIGKISTYLANAPKDYQNHYALLLKIAEEDGWQKKIKPAVDTDVQAKQGALSPEETQAKIKEITTSLFKE